MDISLPYLHIFTEKRVRPHGNIFLILSIPADRAVRSWKAAAGSLEQELVLPGG